MKVLVVTAYVAVMALWPGCSTDRNDIRLPIATGHTVPVAPAISITVDRDRQVLLDETPVSLRELKTRLRAATQHYPTSRRYIFGRGFVQMSSMPVNLYVDRSVPYLHVVWILNAMRDSGVIDARVAVTDGRAVQLALDAGCYLLRPDLVDVFKDNRNADVPKFELVVRTIRGESRYTHESETAGNAHELGLMIQAALARRGSVPPPLGFLIADRDTSFQAVLNAYTALIEQGVSSIVLGNEPASQPVLDARVLPRARGRFLVFNTEFAGRKDRRTMSLPITLDSRLADPAHDHIVVHIDSQGRATRGGVPFHDNTSLLRMIRSSIEEAELFMLVRAHRRAAWARVYAVVSIAKEAGMTGVSFGVARKMRSDTPLPPQTLGYVITVRFGKARSGLRVCRMRVNQNRSVLLEGNLINTREVSEWIRNPGIYDAVEIEAEGTTPYEDVVAVLEALMSGGFHHIIFRGRRAPHG